MTTSVELADVKPTDQPLLFNREISWIEFNKRVLEEGLDQSQPLLERLNFLSIFSSNLDEFFMVRVSGLKQQLEEEPGFLSPDGMTPAAQLSEISVRLRPLIRQQMQCFNDEIVKELAEQGILITPYRALSDRQRRSLSTYFTENVFPVLTPLAVDPSHPFPHISGLSLNLGVMVCPNQCEEDSPDRIHFARIKVPSIVPRLIPVPESQGEFTLLEELVAANLDSLFPGMRPGESHMFRVTRDAELEIKEEEADDLLRTMEEHLRRRRFGSAVRLEVSSVMPTQMVDYLTEWLDLSADDVFGIDGPLDLPGLSDLYKLERPELKYRHFLPATPKALQTEESVFDVMKRGDLLVHHPYDSFSTITDFIRTAARDPDVLAIKTTLYRTGRNSPIIKALIDASEREKQVAAVVEIKARFDEVNNIGWARQLEQAGVHVVYGLLGLKTHCKLALVIRKEGGMLRRYVHISTGNYNPGTARIYVDIGLLTSDARIGADATDLFNFLTGYSRQAEYRRLIVAPINLRHRMVAMIDREIANQQAGKPSRIIAKTNSLTDDEIIRQLYRASQAGVKIDLLVRGICMLRPGVPGLSEGITVSSIVGRFLEHSRIYYFENGGDDEIYIGSADWMYRNLDRRVELLTPIDDPRLKKHVKDNILAIYLKDNLKARDLLPDGSYQRRIPGPDGEPMDAQMHFLGLVAGSQGDQRLDVKQPIGIAGQTAAD